MNSWTDYLNIFLETPAVVGAERPFILRLQKTFDQMGLATENHLGILAVHGTRPDSHYLSAHIDRHGLLCTGPDEYQYAAFVSKFDVNRPHNSYSRSTYQTILNRFIDQKVFAYEPWSGEYIGSGKIVECFFCPDRDNTVFSIPKLKNIPVGAPLSYKNELNIADGLVSAQLDNVLSAALIADLYQRGYQGTAFFTCEEEVGKSWLYLKQYFKWRQKSTQRILVLDTSPFDSQDVAVAQGIVLRNRDANAVFAKQITHEIAKFCEDKNYHFSFKDRFITKQNKLLRNEPWNQRTLGRTELGRLIDGTNNKLNGTTIQIPTTGYHTNQETAAISSIELCLEMLSEYLIDA